MNLEKFISSIEPFEIHHEGEEIEKKYNINENEQIECKKGYDLDVTIHVQPVYNPTRIKAEGEPSKYLYRNDVTVVEAIIYKDGEQVSLSQDQYRTLETAIENKISVFPKPE